MIRLLFAGDLIPPESSEIIYSAELKKVLQDKDFSIVNLEAPLTKCNSPILKTGKNFKRSPETIKHINEGYFDAVALSNNHIRDYGNEGVIDTIETCKQNNIETVGAGRNIEDARKPLRIQVKGKRISILNYSEREFNIADENSAGANPYDNINAFYDIQEEKQENGYVIVVYHGGIEYQYYPSPEMVRKFKYMIDVGADAVIAHHTHRYSGSLVYKEKPLLFGLGNFLSKTSNKNKDEWLVGIIAQLRISNSKVDFEIFPTIMDKSFSYVSLYSKQNEITQQIESISKNIHSDAYLNEYWAHRDYKDKIRIINLIKSRNKMQYKIRKCAHFLFSNKLNSYKKNIFLNFIQCDSHRERIQRILKK